MGSMQNRLYFIKLYFANYCDCQIVSKGALFRQNLKMELVLLSYNHLSSHMFFVCEGSHEFTSFLNNFCFAKTLKQSLFY